MRRQLQRLSTKAVESQKCAGYWPDGGGLYLQVSPTRTKSWIFRYTKHGKTREMGLGSMRAVGLADARRRAADAYRLLSEGIDPLDAKKMKQLEQSLAKARTITFSQCARTYIASHAPKWKNQKHAGQWTSTIETYATPVIGSLPVQDVDTALVLKVLQPIWNEKTETASRLRSRIEQVLYHATVYGYRSGENPARWRGHLDKLLPAIKKQSRVKHHPALPFNDINAFMVALRAKEGIAARALEFTILCTSRTIEVLGARPEEFDLKKCVWTIPKERMKGGREHRVPLSARAVEIVRSMPVGKYVFPGQGDGKPLSNAAMLAVLNRMGRSDITTHGFRSTFRDWASECKRYEWEVCEMALAHTIGDKAEAAYRRGDLLEKRRPLMAEWARYCDQRGKVGKVLKLRTIAG